MTREEMIAKLRRLHTLLTIERRSNNLALALRRAMAFIESWKESPDQVSAKISTRRLFAGYGPKFLRIYDEIRESGTCELLEELQRRHSPFFCALCEIPSIGVGMARRMYYDRSICSPADLQIAYSNRILEKIPAFGEQRLKAVETWLVDPPKSHFEVADSGNRSAKAQIGEASDRGRRNAKIFQSSVFNAIGKAGRRAMPSQMRHIRPILSLRRAAQMHQMLQAAQMHQILQVAQMHRMPQVAQMHRMR